MSDPVDPAGLFCHDLPTAPCPGIGTVLVTGASGYVGGRLVPELLARGYDVRAMVRGDRVPSAGRWPGAHVVVADALDDEQIEAALDGVSVAYYLLHSLAAGPNRFESADIRAARGFREAAARRGVGRIVYLGGLGDRNITHSRHLRSRVAVGEELGRGAVPLTALRAAIIIGSGSASFEIFHHLVRNLPVIPIPHWGHHLCQPISIRDVVKYLVGVIEQPETAAGSFDIGGREVLTYREMLERFADLLGLRRLFLRVPFSQVSLSAYVASLVTPVPAPIIDCLIEGLSDDVVCGEERIRELLPFETLSYAEAVRRAVSREETLAVDTRWSDAYPTGHELVPRLPELRDKVQYTVTHSLVTSREASRLFASICRIGGREGWFHGNWMWRLRGMVDRLLRGVGTARGRKSCSTLMVGDVIDFWRIEDLQEDRRLLLRAEMKLPGHAWLELTIEEGEEGNRLSVRPYYYATGAAAHAYWYAFLPFHHFIFQDLVEQIEARA